MKTLTAWLDRVLVDDWRRLLRISWSFWGNVLLAVTLGIAGGFTADGTFYWPMAIANLAVAVVRLVSQGGKDADQ